MAEKAKKIEELALQIAQHQANIQRLGMGWSEIITEQLGSAESELQKTLKALLENKNFTPNTLASLKKYREIEKALKKILDESLKQAKDDIGDKAVELAENEEKFARRITKETAGAGVVLQGIGEETLRKIVDNGIFTSRTMEQWFRKLGNDTVNRIMDVVTQGVGSGWTIQNMIDRIRGTKENGYSDGIMETSRREAVNLARTVTSGVANESKLVFYKANPSVVIAIEILGTLDGRICPVCAGLDGARYSPVGPIPKLPVHPQCRCIYLPVTPLSDLEETTRPAANADFMSEAKRTYQQKYPGKNWEKLALSTKQKYYYQAMKDYEKRTGRKAYSQVPGSMSFQEYFKNHMTEHQKKDWLGPERYDYYKKHQDMSLDKFIPPYPDKRYSVKQLKDSDKESFKS